MKKNQIKQASFFALFGNIFLLFAKFFVGFIFKSQSMIADATNSAGDILASCLSVVGNKLSTQPADENHNMGHGKNEYFFSLLIGLSMIIVSCVVIYNSINNLITGNVVNFSYLLIVVCLLTILIKLTLYIYTKKLFKKRKSILLKSLYEDHRNDIFVAGGTLISILFSIFNIYFVDSIVGILISCWIIFTGYKLFMESYDVLIDSSIGEKYELMIKDIVENYSKDIKMGSVGSVPIGYKYVIVLTIYVDGMMTVKDSHDITKDLTKIIKNKIKIVDRVIVHVNPME